MPIRPFSASDLDRAAALHRAGRLDEAENLYRAVLGQQPLQFDALYLLGLLCAQSRRLEEAIDLLGKAVEVRPYHGDALNNLAVVLGVQVNAAKHSYAGYLLGRAQALIALGKSDEALIACERALRFNPADPDALHLRGIVLHNGNRFDAALDAYDRALLLQPDTPEILNNRGNLLLALRKPLEAIDSFQHATLVDPNYPAAFGSCGNAFRQIGRFDEAARQYRQLLDIAPGSPYALGLLLHARLQCCDWTDHAETTAHIEAGLRQGQLVEQPWQILAYSSSPELQQRCTEIYVSDHFAAPAAASMKPHPRDKRIRVAWMSPDFREGVEAETTAALLELQDRSRFETFGISVGPDDGSPMRARMTAAFEHFVDAWTWSDDEVRQWLAERRIDIVATISAHSGDNRLGVLAARCAPVQVSFGYPGTTGSRIVDYSITDRHAVPAGCERFYTERLGFLPEPSMGYYVPRRSGSVTPSRASLGLPDKGFVFCSFNNSYKIQPDIFDIWMRMLRAVDGSVLWLRQSSDIAIENLNSEAAKRGVSPSRLIFAPRLPSFGEHLARYRVADLFLDTFPYNACTTACDALSAGLPLVTCMGRTAVSRVTGSLLEAAGLPGLAAGTLEEYESLVLQLAANPTRLAEVRTQLTRNQLTDPPFDTDRYRRHIEMAFTIMYERNQNGLPPQTFDVPPIEPKTC